ncbi:MAG: hypothetical protein ACRD0F_10695, partial [Acidimicrobiales bacterium]
RKAERAVEPGFEAQPAASPAPAPAAAPARAAGGLGLLAAPLATAALVIGAVGGPLGAFPRDGVRLTWLGGGGGLHLPTPTISVASGAQSFVPGWAKWNYSGYEGKPDHAEYETVVATMAQVGRDIGCGRAMWEYEPELNRFGTPMALMLLPYWTDGCIGSMEGLFFESSATVPYHFLNQSELSLTPSRAMRDLPYRGLDVRKGVEHLRLLGVRYYMALSPEAKAQAQVDPGLRLVASTPAFTVDDYPSGPQVRSWAIFEVLGADLVAPLTNEPVVVESGVQGKHGWLDASVEWYQDASRWDVLLADGGPSQWQRVAGAVPNPPRRPVKPAAVRN